MDCTELMALVKQRDQAKIESDAAQRRVLDLNAKIKATCPHPMTIKGYGHDEDEYGKTIGGQSWDECTICGAQLNMQERRS